MQLMKAMEQVSVLTGTEELDCGKWLHLVDLLKQEAEIVKKYETGKKSVNNSGGENAKLFEEFEIKMAVYAKKINDFIKMASIFQQMEKQSALQNIMQQVAMVTEMVKQVHELMAQLQETFIRSMMDSSENMDAAQIEGVKSMMQTTERIICEVTVIVEEINLMIIKGIAKTVGLEEVMRIMNGDKEQALN